MPTNRPPSLRPMLSKRKYALFAKKVNAAVEWDIFTWSLFCAAIAMIFSPAVAHWILVSKHRVILLLIVETM